MRATSHRCAILGQGCVSCSSRITSRSLGRLRRACGRRATPSMRRGTAAKGWGSPRRTPTTRSCSISMVPELDGLTILRRLRAGGSRTSVLIITARDQVHDRVAGLDLGADDYLVKPFAFDELLARLRALIRRRYQSVTNLVRVGDLGDRRGGADHPTRGAGGLAVGARVRAARVPGAAPGTDRHAGRDSGSTSTTSPPSARATSSTCTSGICAGSWATGRGARPGSSRHIAASATRWDRRTGHEALPPPAADRRHRGRADGPLPLSVARPARPVRARSLSPVRRPPSRRRGRHRRDGGGRIARGRVRVRISARSSTAVRRPAYFEAWLDDGKVLARSPSLGARDLAAPRQGGRRPHSPTSRCPTGGRAGASKSASHCGSKLRCVPTEAPRGSRPDS